MIKDVKIGNVKDVRLVLFGRGTTSVTNACAQDGSFQDILLRCHKKARPVGKYEKIEPDFDAFAPNVVIRFESKEAFDVFYEYVEKVRKEFENKKN